MRSHLDELIVKGAVGDRLPSVRQLMAELGVSPTTIRTAVSELSRSGRVEAISGSGTFIAAKQSPKVVVNSDYSWQSLVLPPDSADRSLLDGIRGQNAPGIIDLASGYPDVRLQPVSLIAAAVRDAARRPGAFGRAPSEGIGPLCDWFAQKVDPSLRHRVLIMPGAQAALSLIFRALCLPGDTILMESPTYAGALVSARSAGLTPMPVPLEDDGIDVEQLRATAIQSGARILYLQSRFQNPTGVSMSPTRCHEVLEIASELGLLVIEDDWISDLAAESDHAGPLAKIDDHGHVIHLRSLTKSVAPGIRVAAIASAGPVAALLLQARSAEDFFVSPLLQETALGVVTSRRWPTHLRRLRTALVERRRSAIQSLERVEGVRVQLAGSNGLNPLHIWCSVEGVGLDVNLREAALRHGVSIVDGSSWYPGNPEGQRIRLSVAAEGIAEIADGIQRLDESLGELRRN